MFVCSVENCGRRFTRKYALNDHINQRHTNIDQIVERCFLCGHTFANCDELQQHYSTSHRPSRRFIIKESAFKRNFVTYRYNYLPNEINFETAQNGIKQLISKQIANDAARKMICKVSLIFIAEMVMTDHQGERVSMASIPFRATNFLASAGSSSEKNIKHSFLHQRMSMDEFMRSGSNWRFSRALAFDVEVSTVKPIRGGSTVDIDSFLNKRFLYNPPNKNNKCFLFCIAYFLLFGLATNKTILMTPENNLKIKQKTFEFKTAGIKFPMSTMDIKKFLRKNSELNLKVNVLYRGMDDKIYPLEFGLGDGKNTANILFVETEKANHYLLIKDIDKYLRKVYNRQNNKKLSYQKASFCVNCLNFFQTPRIRDQHMELCSMNRPRIERTPEPGQNVIKFKNFEHQHRLEYVAFLDFECILPSAARQCVECNSLKCKCDCSFTTDIHHQLPITYSFVILGPHDKILHEHTYSGDDAHKNFINHLLNQEESWIKTLLQDKKFMIFTDKDEKNFNSTLNCYLCGIYFDDSVVKCRDHSHISSKYLGAACQSCNLRRRRPTKLKIFIHNCSKYDMHFLIKALSSFKDYVHDIQVLPYNGENFRTLKFNSFEFLDSLSFLQASLAELSSDLRNTDNTYKVLKQTYLVKKNGKFNMDRFKMVLEKSFFPYEFCTSLQLMKSTKNIPKRKHFYSSLSEEKISVENYNFAKKVWKEFDCKNLLEYTELYCKIDTILLAEIFQAFRSKMIEFSGLDPAHYISLPAYGYDSMLKITKSEIELPTDINIIHFLESAKRGGVSFINTRYLQCHENEKAEIIYQDRNNLYGGAQMLKLPYSDFRWLNEKEIEEFNLDRNFDGDTGYFVECDLHYPKKLHKSHSNFPLAPEILEVSFENLSPYTKKGILETEGKRNYKDVKLMSTFHDRIKYVVHIKNLKLYLSLGMELIKIHRILEFNQHQILAPFIEMTTAARKNSSTKFESDQYKKLVRNKK